GLIEAGALEQDRRPGAKDAPQLILAALWTLFQRLVLDRLELIKVVFTGVTLVFVGWHGRISSFVRESESSGRSTPPPRPLPEAERGRKTFCSPSPCRGGGRGEGFALFLRLFFGNQFAVQAGEALAADRDDLPAHFDGEQIVQFLVIANQHRHAGDQTER